MNELVQLGQWIARRGGQEHTSTRTALGTKEGPMGVGNGWEQLHLSELPLHTRRCLMLPPLSLTFRLMVFRISRWWLGSFHESPPGRDFKPLDSVQTSGFENSASEMFSFCDPLQLSHEFGHYLRVSLPQYGEAISPARPESAGPCPQSAP